MNTTTTNLAVDEAKYSLAAQLLLSEDVLNIAGYLSVNRDFMTELLMSYHRIDPKAVFGAQHAVDFLRMYHATPREFNILANLCKFDVYNFVVLTRALQLGIIRSASITNLLVGVPTTFDFDDLDQKVNARVKLFRQ